MNIGMIFLVAAVILFFLAAVGSALIPNPTAWGLVSLTLGILLAGVPLRRPG